MKKFLSPKLLFLIVLTLMAWVAVKYPNLIKQLKPSIWQLKQVLPTSLTEKEVISQINIYRTANKMVALSQNEKLDKAALARLRVIKTDADFLGEKTGLSRENAAKNNEYNYRLIGDLYAEGVNGSKLVDLWQIDENGKKTLDEKGFRDIGVAIEQVGLSWNVMVIMGRKATAVTEKMGAGGYPAVAWGGPELWDAINKRRVELGVGQVSKRDELCTIASIRLNQLLTLGTLDGHAGFEPTLNRADLAWIKEKYNIAEFLIVGYQTPTESVAAWEHTLGHRGLLAGGEYVWGCVYSQNTFGVAIAAY